jgi:polyisoprenoid-binding protein YceI
VNEGGVQRRSARRGCLSSLAGACALACLTACQTAGQAPPAAAPPAGIPPAVRPSAGPTAQAVSYAVRSDLSDVRFLVYRAGPIAKLGHDHVIRARTVLGEIKLDPEFPRSAFELSLPVADFEVDPADARSVEGEEFARQPSAEAIAGTARNLLGSQVLDAEHFPRIEIRSVALVGPSWGPDITVRIALRGAQRDITIPVAVERQNDRLTATATFDVRQTDFGIAPLSALGGSLQVADVVRVRMRLVAVKA